MGKKRTAEKRATVRIPEGLAHMCVPVSTLKLWKDNPRHNDVAVPKLMKAIQEHGFRVPIVVDQDGIIRAGNTRFKAAKKLGMTEIPAVQQEFLNEEQATAFALIDNKSNEWATWDDELLARLFSAKAFKGYAGKTGFDDAERRAILMEPDVDRLNKVKAKNSGLKGKVIVLVMDAAQVDDVKEMLKLWVESKGLDVEVK